MKRITTPSRLLTVLASSLVLNRPLVKPRPKTLQLLRMMARVRFVDQRLPDEMQGLVLN